MEEVLETSVENAAADDGTESVVVLAAAERGSLPDGALPELFGLQDSFREYLIRVRPEDGDCEGEIPRQPTNGDAMAGDTLVNHKVVLDRYVICN